MQGPPGTGKTAVSCQIIAAWVHSGTFGEDSILACSESNTAVDNLVHGLLKEGINCLRLGRPESTSPQLIPYSLEGILQERHGTDLDLPSRYRPSDHEMLCAVSHGNL